VPTLIFPMGADGGDEVRVGATTRVAATIEWPTLGCPLYDVTELLKGMKGTPMAATKYSWVRIGGGRGNGKGAIRVGLGDEDALGVEGYTPRFRTRRWGRLGLHASLPIIPYTPLPSLSPTPRGIGKAWGAGGTG